MARLKALGIWVPTFPFCAYHDDGYVSSIRAHAEMLSRKYGKPIDINTGCKASGMTFTGEGVLRTHYHIFYLNKKDRILDVMVRGHEETHFLELHGFLDKLERKLLEEQGVRINLGAIQVDNDDTKGQEVIAHIGGIYAMARNGLDPHTVRSQIEEFNCARSLYNESRIAA